MKYLLLVAVVLAVCNGCGGSINVTQTNVEMQEPPSLDQVVLGFDSSGAVSYNCEQKEVNLALVWDQCEFENLNGKTTKNACIQLSYQLGDDVIATSRMFCSGPLYPGDRKENFAVFTAKNGRDRLESACGSNMVRCKLTAKEVVK